MKPKLLVTALVCIAATANNYAIAENWIAIVDSEYYVDLDSRHRNGEIASISIRMRGIDGTGNYDFDCKRRLWLHRLDDGKTLDSSTPWGKVLDTACKRGWEVWK